MYQSEALEQLEKAIYGIGEVLRILERQSELTATLQNNLSRQLHIIESLVDRVEVLEQQMIYHDVSRYVGVE
jgi:ABC-type phosphate transport system auxiliary subunit